MALHSNKNSRYPGNSLLSEFFFLSFPLTFFLESEGVFSISLLNKDFSIQPLSIEYHGRFNGLFQSVSKLWKRMKHKAINFGCFPVVYMITCWSWMSLSIFRWALSCTVQRVIHGGFLSAEWFWNDFPPCRRASPTVYLRCVSIVRNMLWTPSIHWRNWPIQTSRLFRGSNAAQSRPLIHRFCLHIQTIIISPLVDSRNSLLFILLRMVHFCFGLFTQTFCLHLPNNI